MTTASAHPWLRNLFILFILIQFAPIVLKTMKDQYKRLFIPSTKVGIITIKGSITDSSALIKHLKEFHTEDDIKAIVLKIESPGGAPGASQSLFYAIRELKSLHKKPIIAWVQNIAASGAYYVACAADRIVAPPSALIGSVGVYLSLPQLKEFIEQFKARYSVISSGAYKTAGNPLVEPTAEQITMLQELCDSTYQQFIRDVLSARPQLSSVATEVWANGRIFDALKAAQLGLIDNATASPLTVESELKQLAHITTEIEWVHPARASYVSRFLSNEEESDDDHPYINAFARLCAKHFYNQIHESSAPQLHVTF